MEKEKTIEETVETSSDVVIVSEILPSTLTVIPITHRPIFPGFMAPLTFSGRRVVSLLKERYESDSKLVGLVLIREIDEENYYHSKLHSVGTIIKIFKLNVVDEYTVQIVAQGLQRFQHLRTIEKEPLPRWKVAYISDPTEKPTGELKAYTLSLMTSVKDLLKLNPIFQEQLKLVIQHISHENPGLLMDMVASMLNADPEKLQELLETTNLVRRAEYLLILLREEIELTELQDQIEKKIEEKVSKQQREFLLREQLKIIKKELGLEKDDKSAEVEKFQKRIQDMSLSPEAAIVIKEELDKLQMLEPSSPEFNVTRSYLNALTELPWGIYSPDSLDIKKARTILDEDHYGLNDVKKLILEFIGTIIKRGAVSGSILCLVGPPGVGKTSIGKSIARALDRKFYRFSVGGMRDEAEIKGHRRTYIGAMPGKIMQCLKRTGTANPVIMLDEIDKLGKSFMGDPASALLEVLDPEQNKDFLDHYLDVRFDLSKVLFVTTANQLDTIPQPLLDRMEVIKLSGYIMEEKVQIAKRYLVPRQRESHGLKAAEIQISDPAMRQIVENYAREAGVRNLEKMIRKIMRQVTLKQAEGDKERFSITTKNLSRYLGHPIFTTEKLYKRSIPGVTLGLAWTSLGGATLYIEASALRGHAGFKQTGQLGAVMKESAEIAFSYVRSALCDDEKYCSFFNEHFIHLHVPAGATPKDGPSAGITMALALYSLATGKAVRKNLAMTGELTLTGKVLPIGGVKEKTIAARRVGITELIFPIDNKQMYLDLPEYIRAGITVHFVDYFDDVLTLVF
jgi:ATP-dependent Lon protease